MKEVYTLEDLQNWDRVQKKSDWPIRLGVFGHPVAHSRSPEMQNAALRSSKIDLQYARFEIAPHELDEALKLVRQLDFVGVNLTVPHKIAAVEFLGEVDPNARRARAVNTVKIDQGTLRGFNTDGKGFARAIREEFVVDLRDLRVLLLGAGGAARAIALQCAQERCERLVLVNRSFDKAKTLTEQFREFFAGPKVLGPVPRLQAIPWEESALRFQLGNSDLVVNATSLGLNHIDPSPIPARLFEPHLMVYDTVYCEHRTLLVSAAMEAGARAANGWSMLLHQGALAFEIWFGREAPLEVMRTALGRGD